jgi:ABC-type Fe3+-siderophore transport system permease subunit
LRGLNIQGAGSIQVGQSPRSHSGVASVIANQRFNDFRKINQPLLVQYQFEFNKTALVVNLTLLILGTLFLIIHN